MINLKAIDNVLQKTAELLSASDASSVSDGQVLSALGWPAVQQLHVRRLMAQLVDEGALRGPKNGPLRGDNQIMAVDVLDVTPQGRQRLADATRPWWRHAWRFGAAPAAKAVGAIVAAVIVGVLVAILTGNAPHLPRLP